MKVTPLKISIHNDNVNPVFGETAIHVELMDQAGGGFLKIETLGENTGNNTVELELIELETICRVGRELLDAYKNNCGG